ncbi:MAG: hypothetical protein RR561_02135 [Peptostreptococcus sp.]|uniref:hypothetical protein n=1 Tax=Peptostreptococcus sp. TaxID=1262 RepID=UPI002FC7F304
MDDNKKIIRRAYIHGAIIFIIFIASNVILDRLAIKWAIYPYQTIIAIVFSSVIIFSEITIRTKKQQKYKKNRFVYIMMGAISMITIISYARDVMSGAVKVIKGGVLTVESCMAIISMMFMILFISYVYKELKIRKEMNS